MTTTTTTDEPTPDAEDCHVVLYALVDGETRVFVRCGQPKHLVDAHEVLRLIISAEFDNRSAVDAMFEYLDGIEGWRGPDYVFGPRGMEVRTDQRTHRPDSVGNDASSTHPGGQEDGT